MPLPSFLPPTEPVDGCKAGDPDGDGDPDGRLHHRLDYFVEQYRTDPDPWGFDSEWYEERKYDLTVAILPRPRYRRAMEPGCSNGALTQRLAARCDAVVAFDVIPDAVVRACCRLANHENVEVTMGTFPTDWPQGTGDLIVLSEVAYYLTAPGRSMTSAAMADWLEPGGHLVAVHYTGDTDYPMTGGAVAEWIDALGEFARLTSLTDPLFEIGVWVRRP